MLYKRLHIGDENLRVCKLTSVGVQRPWLLLPWSCNGHTGGWLLHAVVVVVEERNSLWNVIGS